MFDIYSSHIFMFPFRFDWNEKGFKNKFDFYKERTIDQRLEDPNGKKLRSSKSFVGWELKEFDLKEEIQKHNDKMYNEYAYFYDYARDAIYNIKGDKDPISYYFESEHKLKNAEFQIDIKDDKSYKLDMVGLSLRIFTTGIGILSIELENRDKGQSSFEDILKINDFGRRIYPQFIADGNVHEAKKAFLPDSIRIKSDQYQLSCVENFCFTPCEDIVIGSHIMKLLGDSFTQKKDETEKCYIQPSLDDRMFVISWYGNTELSNGLKCCHNYKSSDKWYEYLFIDGKGANVQNSIMKEELLKEATYTRWTGYGTFWGVTRYSCMLLTDYRLNEKNENFGRDNLKVHLHTMYFQMITLLLSTRASILRFSDEIASLALNDHLDTTKLNKLYQRYLTFYNRLYFKEVTHQDQGIELYDMAREQMNIDDHIEKLDKKFTKLFEFAEIQSNNESNESMNRLTIMGTLFLPPSLLVALYSMEIFDYNQSVSSLSIGLIAIMVGVIMSSLGIALLKKWKKSTIIISILFIAFFSFLVIYSFENIGEKKNSKPNVMTEIVSQVKSIKCNVMRYVKQEANNAK